MNDQRHDGPAFPFIEYNQDGSTYNQEPGMTLRQYAAIKLKVPDSGTDWLDEMIQQSLHDDFASKALIPLLEAYVRTAEEEGYDYDWQTGVAKDAYFMADAMIQMRKGGAA